MPAWFAKSVGQGESVEARQHGGLSVVVPIEDEVPPPPGGVPCTVSASTLSPVDRSSRVDRTEADFMVRS